MSDDPMQQLFEAGAIPSNPFESNSRYRRVALGVYQRQGDAEGMPYVLRRFIPRWRSNGVIVQHTVEAVDRPDSVAAKYLGDPGLYWRVADANGVTDPFELTDTVGVVIAVPESAGV